MVPPVARLVKSCSPADARASTLCSRADARASTVTVWLTAFAGLLAVLGLLGNALNDELLGAMVPGRPRMQVSTGLMIVLMALRIALRSGARTSRVRRVSSLLIAALALLLGALVTAEYVLAVRIAGDWSFAQAPASDPSHGRPSPLTATIFSALGAAMLLVDASAKRAALLREGLCLTALFFAFVSLVGHAFGAGPLYEMSDSSVIGVALPTGLALTALGIVELIARPDVGLVRLLRSQGPGGVLLRRLGLTAVIAGPLLGALMLAALRAIGLVDMPLTLALGNVLAVSFALVLLVATAVPVERSNEEAEASRAHVRELVELAPEGIFIADLEGRYTEVNLAGCRLLGLSREEILGKTILDLIPSEDTERLWESRAYLLTGRVHVSEWRLRHRDGRYVPVEVTAKILPDGSWQGFVRDITERRELEHELLESRDFLKRVLESSTEHGIVAQDLEQRVILWNEGARRIYGYADDEIRGQSSDLLVASSELETYAALQARALEQGSAEGMLVARRKDGSTFSANVVCTRRIDPDNRTAGVLIVSRDLTAEQRYLAEQEFLSRFGVELASCLEYQETLTRVVQLVIGFLGDLAAIDVLKDGNVRRVCTLHRDPRKSELAQAIERLGPARSPGHPLWQALETKQPVLLSHISEDDRSAMATSEKHAHLINELQATSAMLVPLIARGQLLAVLSISACNDSRRYGQADLRLAMEVARRAALALDNVQLYQQSRFQAAMTTNLAEGAALIRASDGKIVYTNRRFEALFGYAQGELIDKHVSTLNAPGAQNAQEQAEQIMDQLHRTNAWHGEIKNVRKDGSEFWCASSVSTWDHPEHGKVWIALHSDVTERKRLEESNLQSLRDKEILLKEIHHRVKNNLQVISSLFSLQRERTQNEELKSMLDESRARVTSIALVHEQLYRSTELAAIDLDEYLRTLLHTVRSTYGAEGVELEVNAQDVVLDLEEAVPCALMVCELVSNSFKHAFKGGNGKIWVLAHSDAQGLCTLEVADDGAGMPPDLDWTKARSLGLRLVHGFARQLRGAVELDRTRGTRFIVKFALRKAATATEA